MGWRKLGWSVGAAALIVAGTGRIIAASTPSPANGDALLRDTSDGSDWAGYGRTFGEQHFSPLAQINGKTVRQLGLAWSRDLGPGPSVTQPIEVGGTLFFSHGYSQIVAMDAVTGRQLWRYDAKVEAVAGPKMRTSWGMRGIAWYNGRIYFGTADGRLIAIDAKTGKLAWSVVTNVDGDSRYITGAPRIFHNIVLIGHGGADVGPTRGYVTAYDTRSGKQLWRFYTVPGDPAKGFENKAMEMAAKTWGGEWWKFGGGGTVWNAMAYDEASDTVYLGTGNGSPWNQKARDPSGGDNLFLCSIIAVDAKTGAYKWHYQINPGDTWDYNAAMDIELADLVIDGKPRKVLMTAPKNGFFYVIDRTNGKLISAEAHAKVNWASKIDLKTGRPVENPDARFPNGKKFVMWPSPLGAHSWLPMAYSPDTRLVYIPQINKSVEWSDLPTTADGSWIKDYKGPVGNWTALNLNMLPKTNDPLDGTSALIAWDPVRQKEVWRWPTPSVAPGGVMATGGDLVFQGTMDGAFTAHEAKSGKVLWRFAAQVPVLAPPISYSVNGRQYVTVITGMGASVAALGPIMQRYASDYHNQPRRVLTFALGGTAKLPPLPKSNTAPIDDPGYKPDAAIEAHGALIYGLNCGACHGNFVVSGGVAPELRRSPIPLSAEAFDSVVRDGALLANGMPRFNDLSNEDRAAARQYIRSRAAALRRGED